jgi:RNA polymerase sigma factor (sigma-70 family)
VVRPAVMVVARGRTVLWVLPRPVSAASLVRVIGGRGEDQRTRRREVIGMRGGKPAASPHRTEPPEPGNEPDLLGQYLSQITTTPLLTADQEVELAKRIEAGVYGAELLRRADAGERTLGEQHRADLEAVVADGNRAKDRMIRANLRLVVAAARKHPHRGLPLLDVIQEGNLGLIRAVEKFDYTRGFKFSTYAMWWINQFIRRGLAERARAIRLPVHVVEELSRLGRHEYDLHRRLGAEPSIEQLAAAAGMSVARVSELRRHARATVSLDAPVGEDDKTTVSDLIQDTDVLQASEVVEYQALAAQLRALIDTLPPRLALIITLRYGLHGGQPCTLNEVAERIGLTRERVRQLEKEALAELRNPEHRAPLLAWTG